VEVENRAVFAQKFAIARSDHDPAAGGENDPGPQDEICERRLLAIAKRRLALDFEDRRDCDAEPLLELGVRIDEHEAQAAGEHAAERGFAGARKSDQIEIAALELHRGIVEDWLVDEGAAAVARNRCR
jgi:hypothetical protein